MKGSGGPGARGAGCISLIFFITCFLSPWSRGFSLDPRKKITQYVHDVWGVEDGLPQSSVTAITRTRDGYLRLGTEEGLVRFDGIGLTASGKTDVEQIRNNHITVLYEDRWGYLWIGTHGSGLTRIDMENGEFITYKKEDGNKRGLADDNINTIYEDREGNLWVGTGGGLHRLKNGKLAAYTLRDGAAAGAVNAVYEDREGNLLLGMATGLYRLKNGELFLVPSALKFPGTEVRSIYEDRRGNVWIGTGKGPGRLGEKKVEVFAAGAGLSGSIVTSFHEDRHGNLWIGGSMGLARLTAEKFDIYTSGEGLSDNAVLSIYEDPEGSLWVGTNNGLNRLKDGKFTAYTTREGLCSDRVWSVYEDREDNLWIGTDEGVVKRMRNGKFTVYTVREGLSGNRVWSIRQDREGNMWFGTFDSGLNRLRDGKFTTYTRKQGLSHDMVLAIYEDREGAVWIGTGNGLNRLDPGNGVFTTYTTGDGLSDSYIRVICGAREGGLWIGTRGGGLNRFKQGGFTSYTTGHGLATESVRAIHEDKDGFVWIGTYGGGLNRLDPKKREFIPITRKNGLFDDKVHRILEDDMENFWMSCNKGIFRAAKNELNDFCRGKRKKIHCVYYNEKDGMKDRECNGVSQPPGWKSRDGKLWFPTMKGVVMIDPNHIETNRVAPPVKIEEIIVDEKTYKPPLSGDDMKRISYPGKKRFEFHYIGLSFLYPEKVRYTYKLEGFAGDWRDAGNNRIAVYTNLPAGRYRFRVTACNNDGVWNREGVSFSFYLKPYFYLTWWFYGLCALVVLLTAFTVYRYRVRHLHARAGELRILAEMAEKANRAKSEFLANLSHEIRTPMNAILGFSELLESRITDEKQKSYLNAISASGRTLMDLINDILDLSRIEAGKLTLQYEPVDPVSLFEDIRHIFFIQVREKVLDFQVEVAPDLPRSLLLDNLRLRQILFNLVGNAVKFTDAGYIKLAVHRYNKEEGGEPGSTGDRIDNGYHVDIVFSVEDSGTGIAAERLELIFEAFESGSQGSRQQGGTGLGLTIARRLTEMMGGKISVQSEPGKGSIFRVIFKHVAVSKVVKDSAPGTADRIETEEVDISSPGPLSPELKAALPDLIDILQNDFMPRWEKINKTFMLDEIEDFSRDIEELGTRLELNPLANWGKRLSNDVRIFDIKKITGTLRHFPGLIEEIKTLVEKEGEYS